MRRDRYPQNHNIWHYHEDLELIYIKHGTGTLFAGDCIQEFQSGNIALIGANVPHYWLFDKEYLENKTDTMDSIVVHFKRNFANELLHTAPELYHIKETVQKAEKVLWIKKKDKLKPLFESLVEAKGTLRFIKLLEILDVLTAVKHKKLISDNYAILNHSGDEKRMNNIMSYIRQNYMSNIELTELSSLAGMTRNSLCRYFKQKTGKSVLQFVMEIRVSNACRLLNSSALSLKEICFETGFSNAVSFHKVFRDITGLTPMQYRKNKH